MKEVVNIVTGGAGFIGLNLVSLLLDRKEKVVILDNLSEGSNRPGLNSLLNHPNLSFVYGDITKPYDLNKVLGVYDNINFYHLAANSHVDRSITSPLDFVRVNILGTAEILELYRKNQHRMKLLVVSTDEVYGDEGPFPTRWEAPLRTSSPYSASKASADLLVESYRRTYKLPIKLSRCCNNYGEYQNQEKFIPTIIRSIKMDRPIPVYGDGKQMRQWVPAYEHARRLIDLMHSNKENILVGGVSLTNLNLISMISGVAEKVINRPAKINFVTDRPGHDFKYELFDPESISEDVFAKYLEQYVTSELQGLASEL